MQFLLQSVANAAFRNTLNKLMVIAGFVCVILVILVSLWLSGMVLWMEEWPVITWLLACAASFFFGVAVAVPALVILERKIIDHISYLINPDSAEFVTHMRLLKELYNCAKALNVVCSLAAETGTCFCCNASSEALAEDPFNRDLHQSIVVNGKERECPIPYYYGVSVYHISKNLHN